MTRQLSNASHESYPPHGHDTGPALHTMPIPELPPQVVHTLRDVEAPNDSEPFHSDYSASTAIAIDFGLANVRVGLTSDTAPHNVFPTLVARYRDRKLGSTLTLVGNDVLREAANNASFLSNAKLPFDGQFVTNWDYVENILDFSFEHLSVVGDGRLSNPIVMTEPVAAPLSHRKGMYELLYEVYGAPQVAMGIDSLFAFYNYPPKTGLVIGVGHEQTHVIPVVDGRGVLASSRRIDWGGSQALLFLQRLLALKYPFFPTRLSSHHTTALLHDHAYVSESYHEELALILDMDVLEHKDVVVQVPVEVLPEKARKTDEELARMAERRREQGRRLQEQAKKKRMEKLLQREKEHEYYVELKAEVLAMSKADAERRVKTEDFESVRDLDGYIGELAKALKKARTSVDDDDEAPAQSWPLVDVSDLELGEEQLKEKRKQRLLKASHDARLRAREEKDKEEEEKAQHAKEQAAWRERDLAGWCAARRDELLKLVLKLKSNGRLLELMKDRKSMAAQQRMKYIANLANDSGAKKRKRGSTIDNDPTDTFGANDDDWNAYRDMSNEALEEEQELLNAEVMRVEGDLLEHDPNFHHEDTLAVLELFDWRTLVLHKFIHGPRQNLTVALQAEGHDPEELASHPEVVKRNHQLHLNVERIRVPEIYFQPHMAGLDLAGIPEVAQHLLTRSFDGDFALGTSRRLIEHVFLTGGALLLPNFALRLRTEMTAFLPVGAPLNVTQALDPIRDPWRGMQRWANAEPTYVTRAEYEEMGAEYIKEHGLGNVCLM